MITKTVARQWRLESLYRTRKAGRCHWPTETMRGKCWRKTTQVITFWNIEVFICVQHIRKLKAMVQQ